MTDPALWYVKHKIIVISIFRAWLDKVQGTEKHHVQDQNHTKGETACDKATTLVASKIFSYRCK